MFCVFLFSCCPCLDILHCLPRVVGVPLESALSLVIRMSPCGALDTHACCARSNDHLLYLLGADLSFTHPRRWATFLRAGPHSLTHWHPVSQRRPCLRGGIVELDHVAIGIVRSVRHESALGKSLQFVRMWSRDWDFVSQLNSQDWGHRTFALKILVQFAHVVVVSLTADFHCANLDHWFWTAKSLPC